MGTYTYSDFKSKLTRELWNRDDVSTLVGGWVNAAYMDLCTRNRFWDVKMPHNFDFPELNVSESRTTADGTASVATPSQALFITTVFDDTNKRKLSKMSPREYFSKTDRATAAAEGQPTNWTRYGSNLYLWPTPAATYSLSVYYRKRPAEMSDDLDVTAVGAEWDEIILKLAVIQSMMRLKAYDDAAKEKADWTMKVQDLIGIYGKEEIDQRHLAEVDIVYHDWGYGGGRKK
jgi:hypothetical protein